MALVGALNVRTAFKTPVGSGMAVKSVTESGSGGRYERLDNDVVYVKQIHTLAGVVEAEVVSACFLYFNDR